MEKVVLMLDRDELLEMIEKAVSNAIIYPNPEKQQKYLTTDEAYQYLNLSSKGCLYQLVNKKRITSIKKGKQLRFLRDDLDKFMLSGRRKAKTEAQ